MIIYLHGNCQATALALMMREILPPNYVIKNCEVFNVELEQGRETSIENIQQADIIITQPVSDNYRGVEYLSSSWLNKNRREQSRFITIPVIYFNGQTPNSFTLKEIHGAHLSYHDAHAIDYFLNGKTVDELIADTNASDFLPAEFVRSESFLSFTDLSRREKAFNCDINVSDIIINCLSDAQPLYTINHPSRKVLTDLCNRILSHLEIEQRIDLDGTDYLDHFIVAPYVSALLAHNNRGAAIRLDEYKFDGAWHSRTNYFNKVYDSYRQIGAESLLAHVNQHPEIKAYLNRYKQAKYGIKPHNQSNRQLIESLYRLLLGRTPNSNEILFHLHNLNTLGIEELFKTFLNSPEFKTSKQNNPFLT